MKAARISATEYAPRIPFRVTLCLCLISIAGNIAAAFLAAALHLPLFSDTIFTVAVTFYAGFVPGLIVAGLYNPVMTLVECAVYRTEMFYFDFLYALCGMLIVLSAYLLLIAFVSSFL